MKFYYPVIVKQENDGRYHAVFPDLTMCEAYGDTMDDCLGAATEAAYDWIELELQEDEPELPSVTDHEDMHLADGEEVRMILVNMRLRPGFDE
ncbi:MAG: type II toxin-antitoxin system HicB family antitoxin [Eubacterium sp.]|nr:type II toxin-antitoxin system HicB family antitoxin [Eubacterium sp.]